MNKRLVWIIGLAFATILVASTANAEVRQLYIAATDGYAYVPDHNGYPDAGPPGAQGPVRPYYIRGFCDGVDESWPVEPGCANLPAPIIDVNQGDDVFLHLKNIGDANPLSPKDPHTIHLHGMHVTTQNDGFNETSFEVPEGTEAVYYFNPDKAGTYMWHCHVEASEHVQMGMYGALIVRPEMDPQTTVYGGIVNDRFNREYVTLLSDVDIEGHDFIQVAACLEGDLPKQTCNKVTFQPDEPEYNFADFEADYWLVNGRAFPDIILSPTDTSACDAAAKTADVNGFFDGCNPPNSGPPTGFLTGSNNWASYAGTIVGQYGERILNRVINMSYDEIPWHIHGWHFRAVGKDANPIKPNNQREAYTLHIGSGETYDLLITFEDISCRGFNATNSTITDQGGGLHEFAELWGVFSANGLHGDNDLAEQWYPAHSHNDFTVTNNGEYPGGNAQLILVTGQTACAN
jgi:FtsP/CotA-like multicopper oxidase with cupredoxin domain